MLTRITNPEISVIGGVLAGIAYKLKFPTWIIRVAFVILLFITFFLPVVIYLVLWGTLPIQYISKEDYETMVGVPENKEENINK